MPVSLENAWKFFSNAQNLLTITPPFLDFKITNEVFGEDVYPGQIFIYKLRPVSGMILSWVTEITHVENEKLFVDEQRKGPYELWHHQHHFKAIEGGTEMTDLVHYRLPMGIVGEMAHPIVKKKLEGIFRYRYYKIVELFGKWPNQEIFIQIH